MCMYKLYICTTYLQIYVRVQPYSILYFIFHLLSIPHTFKFVMFIKRGTN